MPDVSGVSKEWQAVNAAALWAPGAAGACGQFTM
jgi:hypothetical protein